MNEDNRLQVLQNLRENHGNISRACELAGITRTTYYRWIQDKKFAKKADRAIDAGKAALVDAAEKALAANVKDGDQRAIEYTLNSQGRDRGWGHREGFSMAGENVQVNIIQPEKPEDVDWEAVERERLEMEQNDNEK